MAIHSLYVRFRFPRSQNSSVPLAVMVASCNGMSPAFFRPVSLKPVTLTAVITSSHLGALSDMAFQTYHSFCRITALPQLADPVATTPGDEVVRGIRLPLKNFCVQRASTRGFCQWQDARYDKEENRC